MRYLAFKSAEVLARCSPLSVAYAIARGVTALYHRFDRDSREGVARNLMQIADHRGEPISADEARDQARDTFRNFGRHLVDFFRYHRMTREQVDRLVTCEGVEWFDRLRADGRGVVAVTGHMGSWELAAGVATALGLPVTAVALPQPTERLNELFQRHRAAQGVRVVPFGKAASECLRALRRNEIVALLADRDFTPHVETSSFFGRPARLSSGPARLALHARAPVLPAFLLQLPKGRFHFLACDPIMPEPGMTEADMRGRIAAALEQVISRYTTQWYLFHHFWDIKADAAVVAAMRAERGVLLDRPVSGDGVADVG